MGLQMTDETQAAIDNGVLVKTTQQLDMERRIALDRGENPDPEIAPRDLSGGREPHELDAFVGISDEYRNFSDDTGRPYFSPDDDGLGYFEQRHTDASDAVIKGGPAHTVDPGGNTEAAREDALRTAQESTAGVGDSAQEQRAVVVGRQQERHEADPESEPEPPPTPEPATPTRAIPKKASTTRA